MRLRVIGTVLDRSLQFLDRKGKFSLLPKSNSQRVADIGLTGIELCSFLEFSYGFRQLVLELQRQAEVVVQRGIVRSTMKCRLKFADGSVEIRPLQICNSQIAAIADVIRLEPQCCLEFRDGAGRISNLD